ncbi:PIG-L family deacetylase [Methyloprofundus sp.]|uniref:PIG-L deacetylase family protein n=1 Tax=Methyloprofundus sp. TaxID=2020875 RepID=UPI002602AB2B|nr:PIG-L family deacetylase [Methyloprofundus sp.]
MFKKVLISLLSVVCILAIAYQVLAGKYKYDVTQNYQYALSSSVHTAVRVQIQQQKFSFNSPEKWDTGFIKLDVESNLAGYFAEPFVEVINENSRSVLTLERGVSGERYINLAPIQKEGIINVQLIGHHVTIKDQQAKVILFNTPELAKPVKLIVISPHPDDAEIAAFNLYAQHDSVIVTITAGEAGAHTYDEIYPEKKQHYQAKGKIRVWNSITTPLLAGVSPEKSINLGYFDGTLMQMFQHKVVAVNSQYSGIQDVNYFRKQNISTLTPETSGKATWTALVSDLEKIIIKFQPKFIITPYPAIDAHPDHKLSTIAVIEAIKLAQLMDGKLLLYTNHLTYNDYYPYGQQGGLVPPPPDFNQSLYFDSIYSFHSETPKEKIFALDSMNDLRLDTRWLTVSGAFKVFANTLFSQLLLKDKTYFRKAVRENEIFFSINFSSLYKQDVMNKLKGNMK